MTIELHKLRRLFNYKKGLLLGRVSFVIAWCC